MKKTILITGVAGCIGTNLATRLLADGYRVVGVDNLITSTGENLKELKKNSDFTFVKHDVTKPFPKSLTAHLSSKLLFLLPNCTLLLCDLC